MMSCYYYFFLDAVVFSGVIICDECDRKVTQTLLFFEAFSI